MAMSSAARRALIVAMASDGLGKELADLIDSVSGATSASPTFTGTMTAAAANFSGAVNLNSTVGLNGNLTVGDAKNFAFNSNTGSKIGTANTDKIGFWNAAPVAQQTAPTAATTNLSGAALTVGGSQDFNIAALTNSNAAETWGFASQDEGHTFCQVVRNMQIRIGEIQTALATLGLTA